MGKTSQVSVACPVCGGLFTPVRKGHLYCSEACRISNHRKKASRKVAARRSLRIAEKLKKLSASAFGKYLVKELKRAGSVEALRGHTKESLDELAALRSRCNRLSGYDDGKPRGTYELSHIYAARGKEGFGRLHASNLVIAPKAFNRSLGAASDGDWWGLYTDYGLAERKWLISDDAKSQDVLKKARRYLGAEFDEWLSSFTIAQTQRQSLQKALTKAGVDKTNTDHLGIDELRELAEAKHLEVYVPDSEAKSEAEVLIEELGRFQSDSELIGVLSTLNRYALGTIITNDPNLKLLRGKDILDALAYVCHQGWRSLHRKVYSTRFNGLEFSEFFHEYLMDDDEL